LAQFDNSLKNKVYREYDIVDEVVEPDHELTINEAKKTRKDIQL
jgi:hypothetical protein